MLKTNHTIRAARRIEIGGLRPLIRQAVFIAFRRSTSPLGGVLLALAVASTGCQQPEFELRHDAPSCEDGCIGASPRLQREVVMNRRWQNRTFSELKAALGDPILVMAIPGGGNPPGFVAVYKVDPATGCIDAFAFVYGSDPVIRVYHCR